MQRLRLNLRRGRAILLALLAVLFLGWGTHRLIILLRRPDDSHVRLAAGSVVARRFQIAECLAGEARRRGLEVDVVATKGFEDSVRQVSQGQLDLAAVSSGLGLPDCGNVRLLAGLDIAPLHILVRRGLVESGLSLSAAIKGRRVNLGPPGTNDYLLARDLLSFMKLRPVTESGAIQFVETALSKDELCQLADHVQSLTGEPRKEWAQTLPDVVFTVVSLPSPVVQKLLDTNEYCLVPFPYAQNFLSSALEQRQVTQVDLDRFYVESTTIPAATYVGSSPIPSSDCPTIGLRTILVARADLPVKTIHRMMQAVFESDFTRRVSPVSPRDIATPYDLHHGAASYLDRHHPLITGQLVSDLSQMFSIIGAFSAGALTLYGYLRRRRVRRPGEYLDEIRAIDAIAAGLQIDDGAPIAPEALAAHLDTRLLKLKEQLIHDYCENRVQGEMVLMSVLSMLADSRTQLRRPSRSSDVEQSPRRAA